jgi:hypothetical protein
VRGGFSVNLLDRATTGAALFGRSPYGLLSGMGSGIRGSNGNLRILCIDPAVAVDILLSSILHAFLDYIKLLGQVAYGYGARDGRAAWRTLNNFFAHPLCDTNLVEISINDAFSDQGVLVRLNGAFNSVVVDALFGR